MFFKGSRYADVETLEMEDAQGRTVGYKAIRFTPKTPARMGHEVEQGERLDHIAYAWFQDTERFWRICDANRGMWPADLEEKAGRILLIPSAED